MERLVQYVKENSFPGRPFENGEVMLVKHEAEHGRTNVVWLKGQYKGLAERNGIATPYPAAHLCPSIDKRQIEELATLAFAARAENVILLGPLGVGKTHLAVGLALKALEAGMVVYYTTLSHLM